jgi:hypothetical protein
MGSWSGCYASLTAYRHFRLGYWLQVCGASEHILRGWFINGRAYFPLPRGEESGPRRTSQTLARVIIAPDGILGMAFGRHGQFHRMWPGIEGFPGTFPPEGMSRLSAPKAFVHRCMP